MSTRIAAGPNLSLLAAETGAAALGLGAVAAATPWLCGFGALAAAVAAAVFAAVALCVARGLRRHRPARFGAANAMTLARAAAVSALAGIVVAAPTVTAGAGLAAGSLFILVLDGADGWAARRWRTASAFGARFDMETDALFMMVLALLVWRVGHAGAWVLGAGLLRYGFVLAGRVWPALTRPPPPSRRRRAVCGVSLALLSVAAAPLPAEAATGLCAAALGSLMYSFAADWFWLARRAPAAPAAVCRS